MKKTVFLFAMFITSINCLADPSVMGDLKKLYNMTHAGSAHTVQTAEPVETSLEIRRCVEPVMREAFAKLVDEGVSPLVRDILNDDEAADFGQGILCSQLTTYPADLQADVLRKVFDAAPDSQRRRIILTLLLHLPWDVFSIEEIQKWLVDKINGGLPGGIFYFILTEENANAVSKRAVADMKRFFKTQGRDDVLFGLMSVIFLASRGDGDAIKILDTLLEQRDIQSRFDTTYVIPAAAMSRDENLIRKIYGIVTTDKRFYALGPRPGHAIISFAEPAADACKLTIEGFPSVALSSTLAFDAWHTALKEKVNKWAESNPAYTIKVPSPQTFLNETRLRDIIPVMWGAH